MTDQQLPSTKHTAILLAVLLIPYLVKLIYSEPYPAIILPSGHTKLSVQDSTYCAPRRVIKAVDRNTLEYRIVPSDSFLSPAPVRLLAYWERNEFGLKSGIENSEISNDQELEEAAVWFKVKLNSLGFLADHFVMERQMRCFSKETKSLISEKVTKSALYELD